MRNILIAAALLSGLASGVLAETKKKIFIVSSYHREYLWDQDVQDGVIKGMLELGIIQNKEQGEQYRAKDLIETKGFVVRQAWMDTKRKTKPEEIKEAAERVGAEIDKFKPDVIITGDDNATNHIGNRYLGKGVPVVFYGVDETPVKYGLVESAERPGKNVTGVYQKGFYKEAAEALRQLLPSVKTFAILSDGSETGMFKVKGIQEVAAKPDFPLKLVDTLSTNSFEEFKAKVPELAKRVDAFLMVNHNTMKDAEGKPVDQMAVGNWYLSNIKKPDFSSEKQFVSEGLLLVAEDSAERQGYAALRMAMRILRAGEKPAEMACQRPPRGPIIVNVERARQLGLKIDGHAAVEKTVEKSLALAGR